MDRERRAKEGIARSQSVRERRGEYEMVPQRPRGGGSDGDTKDSGQPAVLVRQRSSSAAASSSRPKDFVNGLKRRVGSLRHRKPAAGL